MVGTQTDRLGALVGGECQVDYLDKGGVIGVGLIRLLRLFKLLAWLAAERREEEEIIGRLMLAGRGTEAPGGRTPPSTPAPGKNGGLEAAAAAAEDSAADCWRR